MIKSFDIYYPGSTLPSPSSFYPAGFMDSPLNTPGKQMLGIYDAYPTTLAPSNTPTLDYTPTSPLTLRYSLEQRVQMRYMEAQTYLRSAIVGSDAEQLIEELPRASEIVKSASVSHPGAIETARRSAIEATGHQGTYRQMTNEDIRALKRKCRACMAISVGIELRDCSEDLTNKQAKKRAKARATDRVPEPTTKSHFVCTTCDLVLCLVCMGLNIFNHPEPGSQKRGAGLKMDFEIGVYPDASRFLASRTQVRDIHRLCGCINTNRHT